ncbi:coiled-coil domain-containing protein [Galbibacter mesophilus]|uniref:hypothetical protein n=1 Tax=Galbibacter mesophilus TaxID=379069 RepID=UPI00191D3EB1|nr:hypothetical protein [Galbibacter mesophilus]MCM5662331.1 hypothetical protein [Galbibacter mesophilus]
MKNFNLSLRKSYLVTLLGATMIASCSTDDTPSEEVTAIRQAESANLMANAEVAAAQAALINAQVQVEIAQAAQIALENALLEIENATAQAEADLTFAQLQEDMLRAEQAKVEAQLALDQAINAMQEAMAEMQVEDVKQLMGKLAVEQEKMNGLTNERHELAQNIKLKKYSLEFGVDHSNEQELIGLNAELADRNEYISDLESDLAFLKETAEGNQDVETVLNTLKSEEIALQHKIDSLSNIDSQLSIEASSVWNKINDAFNLKQTFENYSNQVANSQAIKENLETEIEDLKLMLTDGEEELALSKNKLSEAKARLTTANADYEARMEATATAKAKLPALETAVESAQLAYNTAVAKRDEYNGTDPAVISQLNEAVTEAETAYNEAETALNEAEVVYNDKLTLQQDFYNRVVLHEENTIENLENNITFLTNSLETAKIDIKDKELALAEYSSNMVLAQTFIAENEEAYNLVVEEYSKLLAEMQKLQAERAVVGNMMNSLYNQKANKMSLISHYTNIDNNNAYNDIMVKNKEEQIANELLNLKELEAYIGEIENNMIVNAEDLQQEIDMLTTKLASLDSQIEGQTAVVNHYKDLLSAALTE